jgi:hypothetical protein
MEAEMAATKQDDTPDLTLTSFMYMILQSDAAAIAAVRAMLAGFSQAAMDTMLLNLDNLDAMIERIEMAPENREAVKARFVEEVYLELRKRASGAN